MKVLHLSSSDVDGGAARGAYWLHHALRTRVHSTILVQRKSSRDPQVLEYRPRWVSALARRSERELRAWHPRLDRYFSAAALPWPVHRRINALQPDVVNLHWINDGFLSPESIAGIRAPVVWTLRDLWPMTGGCHYAGSCRGFEANCGHCPALGSDHPNDLSRVLHRRKARAWQNRAFTLVALSRWLAEQARRSSLFAEREIVVIPNALDISVFRPVPQAEARAALGWAPDRRLILFGATHPLSDQRKGFEALRQATFLLARRADAAQLEVVVFGSLYGKTPPDMGLNTHFVGALDDDRRLAQLYAGADVTVMPSLEEAFGKVAMESLACGTPVVCFRDSGPADIVDHGLNGYQARYGDVHDLARGIAFLLDHPHPQALAEAALRKVMTEYTYERQAQAYLNLYEHVLAQARARRSPPARPT
ncbi:glycosyltransferase [Deinococcus sp. YIM 77859]|uniref:glycosyltransferase n=1 Tax=Deinococcus sp. YIM 77859 TaxID=1540221 RepID=UPI0005517A73|nr:glycosyltransferase [Deinococcus sp. YIM 77859]